MAERDRGQLFSRRTLLKTAIFGAAAGWTTWANYLYEPPNSELRKDYSVAWSKWKNSADQLAQTGGVLEEPGFLHGPKLDPNNPAALEYYEAQRDIKNLASKIKEDEFPIVQAQMVGESFGPLITIFAGVSLLIPNDTSSKEQESTGIANSAEIKIF